MKPLSECHLYCFVDTAYLRGRSAEVVAQQLCDGGADIVQLRAKDCPIDEVRRLAEAILPVTARAEVGLVVNDHFGLAEKIGAAVCHLGQEDFFGAGHTLVSEIRAANSKLLVGLSTHSPEQARRALAAGADYIAIGPVYATGTKPNARPVTLEYVRWAAANVKIPWFAIGGINRDNLDAVLEAGARRICAVSAILNSPDVAACCRTFKERLLRCQESGSSAFHGSTAAGIDS
jgi:thiamine-phosphate pyrophosphorylase